ncbi:hypothetical protein SNEBB_010733 [Seison nebaliae]|nr:hypothetical protein SNEBB_010733 [Seison nebaliae]
MFGRKRLLLNVGACFLIWVVWSHLMSNEDDNYEKDKYRTHDIYLVQYIGEFQNPIFRNILNKLKLINNLEYRTKSAYVVIRNNIKNNIPSTILSKNIAQNRLDTGKSFQYNLFPLAERKKIRRKFEVNVHTLNILLLEDPFVTLMNKLKDEVWLTNHCKGLVFSDAKELFLSMKRLNISEKFFQYESLRKNSISNKYLHYQCINNIRNSLCQSLLSNCQKDKLQFLPHSSDLDKINYWINSLKNSYQLILLKEYSYLSLLLFSHKIHIDFYLFAFIQNEKTNGNYLPNKKIEEMRPLAEKYLKFDQMIFEVLKETFLSQLGNQYRSSNIQEFFRFMRSNKPLTINHSNKIIHKIARFKLLNRILYNICEKITKSPSEKSSNEEKLRKTSFCQLNVLSRSMNNDMLQNLPIHFSDKYKKIINRMIRIIELNNNLPEQQIILKINNLNLIN